MLAFASTARLLLGASALLGALLTSCARPSTLLLPAPLLPHVPRGEEPSPVFPLEDGALRLDQLQMMGSHNSYHRAPRLPLSRKLRYTHLPLERQLEEQGVRHLEIDVRYGSGELRVGHAPIIDGRTTCRVFHECIRRVKRWSKEHPLHVPIFVFVQPKEGLVGAQLDGRLELLDREIQRVFSRNDLLLPRDVARGFPSLRSAVRAVGWPALENTRGKVAFVLFGQKRLTRAYAHGRPRLDGRSMFVADSHAGAPHAAVLSIDDPVARQADIVHAVQDRLLVRTRADSGLLRDQRRRQAALQSGAHFVGSDFVDPSDGWLPIDPELPARENPLTGEHQAGPRVVAEVLRERPRVVQNEPSGGALPY